MTDLPWATLAAVALTLVLAYTVYGLSGFGANIVAMPVLAQLLPLRIAVPMLVMFDLVTGATLLLKHHRNVDWREAMRLLPWLVIGIVAGVTLLSRLSEQLLLVALGAFIVALALWNLLRRASAAPISTRWAVPAGLVGGTVTALYGIGGPVYTIYLARRLPDKNQLRATIGGLIFGNSLIRLALFTGTGFYAQPGLLALAAMLLPCALVGQYIGSHLHSHLSAQRIMQVMWWLLILGGSGLIWRGLHVS